VRPSVYVETTIVSYLVGWLNRIFKSLVYEVCRAEGYEPPLVCTPHELLGENDEERI